MVPAWFPLRRVLLIHRGDLYGYSTSMRPAANFAASPPSIIHVMAQKRKCQPDNVLRRTREHLSAWKVWGSISPHCPAFCCPLAVRGLKTNTWKSLRPPLFGATAPLSSQASRGLNLDSRPSPGGSGWIPRLTFQALRCQSACPAWKTVGRRAAQTDIRVFRIVCKRQR
jgi:hypothetical protein